MNRPVCRIQCDVSVVDRFGDVFELCVIWFDSTPEAMESSAGAIGHIETQMSRERCGINPPGYL